MYVDDTERFDDLDRWIVLITLARQQYRPKYDFRLDVY